MHRKTKQSKQGLRIAVALVFTLVLVLGLVGQVSAAERQESSVPAAYACNGKVTTDPSQQSDAKRPTYDLDSVPGSAYVADEIVVKFKDGILENRLADIVGASGGSVISTSKYTGATRVRLTQEKSVAEMVELFRKDSNVEYAEPNFIGQLCMTPDDPRYGDQWHLHGFNEGGINMPQAWDMETGDPGVIVAVLDTGVAYEDYNDNGTQYAQAPDLAGTTFVPGWDFVNNDAHPNDDHWHGTHCTGTIAQSTNNSLGVAGVAHGCAIMPVKVLAADGGLVATNVADGIVYAADHGAKVISMSIGVILPSDVIRDACKYAYEHGVTIVAAAGNMGAASIVWPAAYDDYVIAVGATRYDKAKAHYSSYGFNLDLVAPGGDLDVDQNGDGFADGVLQQTYAGSFTTFDYVWSEGTSMAAPHVAGVAALVISHGVTNPDDVRAILQSTARDLGAPGWDNETAWGLVDAAAALRCIERGGAVHLVASQDAYLSDDQKDYNYGASQYLYLNREYGSGTFDRSVVQFDLSSIPSGATITRAKMNLLCYDQYSSSGNTPIAASRVTNPWLEGSGDGVLNSPTNNGVTFNSRWYGQTWTSSGGDYASPAEDTIGVYGDAWYSWDITELAQDWSQGVCANNGVLLKGIGTGYYWKRFYSSEQTPSGSPGGDGVKFRPYLELTYVTAGTEIEGVAQQDGYMDDYQKNYNYGASTYLSVNNDTGGSYHDRSVAQFNLSGVPAGATIARASLRLNCYNRYSNYGTGIGVHRVTNPWLEGSGNGVLNSPTTNGVTYNSRSYGQTWISSGGDYASPAESVVWVHGSNSWYSWDITSLVQDWVNGTQNNGLMLKGVGSGQYWKNFYSSEYGNPAVRPYLEIVYIV